MPEVAINAAINAKTREDKTPKEHTMWKNQAIEIHIKSMVCQKELCATKQIKAGK